MRKPTTNQILEGVNTEKPMPRWLVRWLRLQSFFMGALARRHYRILTEDELRSRRKSDTVFIFGSGASLCDIPAAEWERISKVDTFSFNFFSYQDYVRADYHLVREVAALPTLGLVDKVLDLYGWLITSNRLYDGTVFFMQGEYAGIASNRILGRHLLKRGSSIFFYKTKSRGRYEPPSSSLAAGLVHGPGTLIDSVNACFLIGYRRIVLAGVDLYDHRYFFLDDNEEDRLEAERGQTADSAHSTVRNGIVKFLGKWHTELAKHNCELMVYNPRSLLTDVLPLFRFPE